jgi:hypothetical protein
VAIEVPFGLGQPVAQPGQRILRVWTGKAQADFMPFTSECKRLPINRAKFADKNPMVGKPGAG